MDDIRTILEKLNMTKSDIERHIKAGVFVYCDNERDDFIESALNCCFDLEEAYEMWEDMDVVILNNGNRYHVEFVL